MPYDITDADFERLTRFIKSNYGIDLTKKRQLITSRLSSTLQAKGFDSFTPFVDTVVNKKDEGDISLLLDKVTTNYTFFMREQDHFEFFLKNILPQVVQRHQGDKSIAIWSAGCSTGEEPYNISMYLMDYLGGQAAQWDTRILATDISQRALTAAQSATYELPDTVPETWRKQYFVKKAGTEHWNVAPKIKSNVLFQRFNLMDPIRFRRPFDVIFCRNVMIYFDTPTKDALVRRFYDAIVPGGYLLIGYAENLSPDTPFRRMAPATFQKPPAMKGGA